MVKAWFRNNKRLVDGRGRPFLCDACPCDSSVISTCLTDGATQNISTTLYFMPWPLPNMVATWYTWTLAGLFNHFGIELPTALTYHPGSYTDPRYGDPSILAGGPVFERYFGQNVTNSPSAPNGFTWTDPNAEGLRVLIRLFPTSTASTGTTGGGCDFLIDIRAKMYLSGVGWELFDDNIFFENYSSVWSSNGCQYYPDTTYLQGQSDSQFPINSNNKGLFLFFDYDVIPAFMSYVPTIPTFTYTDVTVPANSFSGGMTWLSGAWELDWATVSGPSGGGNPDFESVDYSITFLPNYTTQGIGAPSPPYGGIGVSTRSLGAKPIYDSLLGARGFTQSTQTTSPFYVVGLANLNLGPNQLWEVA